MSRLRSHQVKGAENTEMGKSYLEGYLDPEWT